MMTETPPLDIAELRATALESKKRAEGSSDDCLCHLEIAGLANDVLALLDRLEQAQAEQERLRELLHHFLADPHGCSLCDYGIPRSPAKGHQQGCVYEVARAALAAQEPQP